KVARPPIPYLGAVRRCCFIRAPRARLSSITRARCRVLLPRIRLCKQLVVSVTLRLFVTQQRWQGLRAVGLNMMGEHLPGLPLILRGLRFPGLKLDRFMFMAGPVTQPLSLTAATAAMPLVA